MLLYKINDDIIGNKSGDYTYMMNLLKQDYSYYFKASEYLKNRYDFCIEAIYSCLSKVNHIENRKIAYEMLSQFLNEMKKINGINMQIIDNGQFYIKEKPKVKVKKYRLRNII